MKQPWRLKSFIFRVIDYFDIHWFLYFLQKYVTKRSRIHDVEISDIWHKHKTVISSSLGSEVIFEFGAGKSLAQNLYLSDRCQKQIVVDLFRMIDIELVEKSRKSLSNQIVLKSDKNITSINDLLIYGIEYHAPFDAAKTGFAENSIDMCISTNTLEHIPYMSIVEIFTELKRILRVGGIISARIDYTDHYAHTDPSISLLNYLRFDSATWDKYNHESHFQNRLRHFEYLDIFDNLGFELLEEELFWGASNIPGSVELKYAKAPSSWKATSAHIVLKKR